MTYLYAPTIHHKWCDCCQEERAEYRTETREQESAIRTEVYVQDLCLDCLSSKRTSVRTDVGSIIGIRFRNIHGNGWTTEGEY